MIETKEEKFPDRELNAVKGMSKPFPVVLEITSTLLNAAPLLPTELSHKSKQCGFSKGALASFTSG